MTQKLTHIFSSGLKRFFSGIFLSRISGLGRDLAMAYAFGAHPTVAAFMVAFRLSHLLRRFFGEGPLQSAFIPHFEELHTQDPQKAHAFFRQLTSLLILLLIGLITLIEGGIWIYLTYFSPSLDNQEILHLTALLIPSLLFISLYGINLGALQCYNSFFLPSVAPLICNVTWMIGALYLKGKEVQLAIPILAKWVVAGFFLQWALTVPLTQKKIGGTIKKWIKLKIDPYIKRLAKSLSLGILGIGAVQINAFFDTIFSRYADLNGPLYLWYSIRLQQLALAIFAIAAVNTLTPLLSRKMKQNLIDEAKEIFKFGAHQIFIAMFCSTLAIFSLGYFAIDLIYGRGNFSSHAVIQTTHCFSAYSLGLIPTALTMLSSAVFYAQNNFQLPTIAAVSTIIVNLFLNTLFIFILKLGAISTALSTSLSAWLNFLILRHLLLKQGWEFQNKPRNFISLLKGGLFASLMAYGTSQLFSNAHKLAQFLFPASTFLIGLFLYAHVSKNTDLLLTFQSFIGKRSS